MLVLDWQRQHPDCTLGRLCSRMSFIYKFKTLTLAPFVKPHAVFNLAIWVQILCTIRLTYNPEVVLLIKSAKSYNYKYKTSKKLTIFLPTIHQMAYMKSAITYNPGSINFFSFQLFDAGTLVLYVLVSLSTWVRFLLL